MFQESESTMMSYVLDIKWLSGCIEVGDHTRGARRQQVTPFYWSTAADWWWGLIWLMIDHCYVINESFTHPSDKWMICVATIMFIYSYFIYIQVASQVSKQLKSFGNLKNLLKNENWTSQIALFHMKTFVSGSFLLLTHPHTPQFEIFDNFCKSKTFHIVLT